MQIKSKVIILNAKILFFLGHLFNVFIYRKLKKNFEILTKILKFYTETYKAYC